MSGVEHTTDTKLILENVKNPCLTQDQVQQLKVDFKKLPALKKLKAEEEKKEDEDELDEENDEQPQDKIAQRCAYFASLLNVAAESCSHLTRLEAGVVERASHLALQYMLELDDFEEIHTRLEELVTQVDPILQKLKLTKPDEPNESDSMSEI